MSCITVSSNTPNCIDVDVFMPECIMINPDVGCIAQKPPIPILNPLTDPPYIGGTVLEVKIDNFNSELFYYTSTTGNGNHYIDLNEGVIYWSLPIVGGIGGNNYMLSVQTKELKCDITSTIARIVVTVTELDETIVYYETPTSSGYVRSVNIYAPIVPIDSVYVKVMYFSTVCTSMRSICVGCENLETFVCDIDTSQITSLEKAWVSCHSLVEFPAIDFPNVVDITFTWAFCKSLITFPVIDLSSVIDASFAWRECESLETFPAIDFSSATKFQQTWQSCINLVEFLTIDFSNAVELNFTWNYCRSLSTFPEIMIDNVEAMTYTWSECYSLIEFPQLDVSGVINLSGAWRYCRTLTSFPYLTLNSSVDVLHQTWQGCTGLTSHDGVSDCTKTDTGTWDECCALLECKGGSGVPCDYTDEDIGCWCS